MLRRTFSTLTFACLTAVSCAWWDTGHMVIAAIAEQRLDPAVRRETERLLGVGKTDLAYDFITAGPWADDVRSQHDATYHYHDLFFRADGKPVNLKQDEHSALWAINHFSQVLKDRSQSDLARANALRYLIHVVGDVHQPLHGTARVTDKLPNGDRGGNEFRIKSPRPFASMERPPRNLHALWDFGGGLFVSEKRPLSPEGRRKIEGMAAVMSAALPPSTFPELMKMEPMVWVRESFDLSKKLVYQLSEESEPSEEYLEKTRQAAARRATLAGYRLAALLNELLK